ncbi:MAG: energy transducer TonB family protein [Bacteroidota bacterium]
MDPYRKKDKRRAVFGTVLFHLLLLFCLIFFGLRTPLPLPEEEGVFVALGNIDQGMGDVTPLMAPQPSATSSEPTEAPSVEDVVTQSTEESIALPEDKDDSEDESDSDDITPDEPVNQEVEEETVEKDPEPVVDPRALFPGSDDKSSSQDSQGDTDKDGSQGSQSGSIDGDSYEGTGKGGGVKFSLSGRKANYLPIPEYTSEAQGKVVVAITVDRNGQITRANAGARGTTTSDRTLWNLAEEAAKRARFDIKQNAPEEQTGTITYNFIRIN